MSSTKERFEHALMREKNHDKYDPVETHKMYQELADEGYAPAQCKVATVYLACDMHEKCIDMLEKAVAQEDPTAIAQMGVFHYNGQCGLEKSFSKALSYYELAAALGHRKGMLHLAYMLDEGEGCEEDIPRAADIYRELTLGPLPSISEVTPDEDTVTADAAFHLACLCLMGKLGSSDRVKAEGMVMLREACDAGHDGAIQLREAEPKFRI